MIFDVQILIELVNNAEALFDLVWEIDILGGHNWE